MSHRDFAFVAVGRFLAVERYRESQQPSLLTQPLRISGADRTGGHADGSDSRTGSRAPARLQHR